MSLTFPGGQLLVQFLNVGLDVSMMYPFAQEVQFLFWDTHPEQLRSQFLHRLVARSAYVPKGQAVGPTHILLVKKVVMGQDVQLTESARQVAQLGLHCWHIFPTSE